MAGLFLVTPAVAEGGVAEWFGVCVIARGWRTLDEANRFSVDVEKPRWDEAGGGNWMVVTGSTLLYP